MVGTRKSYLVLLADDSEDDRFFLKRALASLPVVKICEETTDGEDAIDYLSAQGPYADRTKYPFPDLLLLDLNMPRKSGYEVLEWIKSRHFKNLPVFVVSNSLQDTDRQRCNELGASAVYPKGITDTEHADLIAKIEKQIKDAS